MPPKAKDKGGPPEGCDGEKRTISVRVEGILEEGLDEPYLALEVPGCEKEFRTDVLTGCASYSGVWVSAPTGDNLPPTELTLHSSATGCEASSKFGPTFRTQTPLSETVPGEAFRVIDTHRTHWDACEVTVHDTCHLTANGKDYVRKGPHGFAFSCGLMEEVFTVTPDSVRDVFGAQLSVKVMTKKTVIIPAGDAVAEKGAKGKKVAASEPKEEVTYIEHTSSALSFVPLVMGKSTAHVVHSSAKGGKARHLLPNFAHLKVVISCSDEEKPCTLLTAALSAQLRPLCFTFISVQDLPDSRPISIHKSEGDIRPFLDTLSTQKPDYSAQHRTCEPLFLKAQLLPGAKPFFTPCVPHERNAGIYIHHLFLLGRIEAETDGTIPDLLQLVRHLAHAKVTVEVHDRVQKGTKPENNEDFKSVAPHGVCAVSLADLLASFFEKKEDNLGLTSTSVQEESEGVDSAVPLVNVKTVTQVVQHRASIEKDNEETKEEGQGDSVLTRQMPGQYMSWGTTLVLNIAMARELPRLSFLAAAIHNETLVTSIVAGATLASLVVLLPDTEEELQGETVDDPASFKAATPDPNAPSTEPSEELCAQPAKLTKHEFLSFLHSERPAASATTYHTLGRDVGYSIPVFKQKQTILPPQLSCMVIRIRYDARSTRKVLHNVMRTVTEMERATETDDVELYTPHSVAPAEPDEPADAKKKAKPTSAPAETPAPAPASPDEDVIHVTADPNKVSGFEIIDGVWRIVLIEGVTTTVLQRIFEVFHDSVEEGDLLAGRVSIIFNPKLALPARNYIKWPQLVPFAPERGQKGDDEDDVAADSIDAGGVQNHIRRVRVSQSLQSISGTLSNYVRRRVNEGLLQAVICLEELLRLETMTDVHNFNVFPTTAQLILLERAYGTTMSSYDVCGSEDFLPFSVDFSETTDHKEATAARLREVNAEKGQYPFLYIRERKQTHSDSTAFEEDPKKQTLAEYITKAAKERVVPVSLQELSQHVGKEVVLTGVPEPPDTLQKKQTTSRKAKPEVTFGGVDTTASNTTVLCALQVHAFGGERITLVMTGLPRPVKNITIEAEGRVIAFPPHNTDGTIAVQVYRWKEAVQGGMNGGSINGAFLAKKRHDTAKLGFTHFHSTHKEKLRKKKAEDRLRSERTQMEQDGYSSGSDFELDKTLDQPNTMPEVETYYPFLNTQSARTHTKKEPTYSKGMGSLSQPIRYEYSDTTSAPTTRSKPGFTQLLGGWRPLTLDDCDHNHMGVRRKGDKKHGILKRHDNGFCDVLFAGDTHTTKVPLGRLEVDAKNAILDNRHAVKPLPPRIEDLTQKWAPQTNPFSRVSDTKSDMKPTRGNPSGFFSGGYTSNEADNRDQDLREQAAREHETWKKNVVVDDVVFHVDRKSHGHPIDVLQGILHTTKGRRTKPGLGLPASPLSIQKPSLESKSRHEVSVVHYAGKSHTWKTYDNKDRRKITPLTAEEKTGPHWGP